MAIAGVSGVIGSTLHGAIARLLERVEALFDEADEVGPADLQMVRLHHRVVYRVGEQLEADGFLVRRVGLADEASLAGDGLDHALAFQLGVRLRHRVAIDAKRFGERKDRGGRLTGARPARGRGGLHLVDHLQVDRFAGLEIELELHRLSYDSRTVGFRLSSHNSGFLLCCPGTDVPTWTTGSQLSRAYTVRCSVLLWGSRFVC